MHRKIFYWIARYKNEQLQKYGRRMCYPAVINDALSQSRESMDEERMLMVEYQAVPETLLRRLCMV